MLEASDLRPTFAAPFGDMMLAGCFGLLQAMGDHLAELASMLRESLGGQPSNRAPWDVEG